MNRMADAIAREQVLPFRVHAQQLDSEATGVADAAVLDFGVQDTGPDGGLWALAIRGVDVSALSGDEFATVWTIRGAPHLYRRSDLPVVAAATWPFSDSDAGRRIFDASKPLKQAGIGNLEALDAVAAAMQTIVTEPLVKGEVSTRLTPLMDKPYRRFCRPCNAIHLYEMPFRLAALRAGLELQAGTSPPVMQPIPGFTAPASAVPDKFDVIRGYLRFLGPATPKQVADFLDAPISDVKARWPSDAVEVSVEDETRWVLDSDVEALAGGPIGGDPAARSVRPVSAGQGSFTARRRPSPGQSAVAGVGPSRWSDDRRRGRRHVAAAQVWLEAQPAGRALEPRHPCHQGGHLKGGGAAGGFPRRASWYGQLRLAGPAQTLTQRRALVKSGNSLVRSPSRHSWTSLDVLPTTATDPRTWSALSR